MTLEEESYEHAPVATGVLIDDGETSAYQIVALTARESWGDERAEALPQASASENAGTPENGNPSNPESPPHTSKAPILSATDSESRVTTEAVAEPEVSSKAHDEPHDAGSGNPETRITIDHPSPMKTHVVAPGESLWSISRHYKTTIDRLRSFNELSDTYVIQPGQILHVESAAGQVQMSVAWHTVRPGENLFQIGRRYGISITEITALNSLADPSQLRIGQRLRVRAARPASRQAKEKRDAAQAASQG